LPYSDAFSFFSPVLLKEEAIRAFAARKGGERKKMKTSEEYKALGAKWMFHVQNGSHE
jgi:hypothetical protein